MASRREGKGVGQERTCTINLVHTHPKENVRCRLFLPTHTHRKKTSLIFWEAAAGWPSLTRPLDTPTTLVADTSENTPTTRHRGRGGLNNRENKRKRCDDTRKTQMSEETKVVRAGTARQGGGGKTGGKWVKEEEEEKLEESGSRTHEE